MKTNYLLKNALTAVALFGCAGLYAQTAKTPTFTKVENSVVGNATLTALQPMYEAASAWGDFNNDGFLDLICSGHGSDVAYLYKNNGDGTFTTVEHPFPRVVSGAIAWCDYNNDGNLDLFISGWNGSDNFTGLYKNNGSASNFEFEEVFPGLFEPVYSGGSNKANRYLAVGDYDNDGWVDLLLTGENAGGRHMFLYKNINGTDFVKQENVVNGVKPLIQMNAGTVSFGDYNNDNYLDILFNGYSNTAPNSEAGYYKNNGDGTFSDSVLVNGGEMGESGWCDYNSDGLLDFFITGYSYQPEIGGNQADLYRNNGDGTFTMIERGITNMIPSIQSSFAWGDVNNDGYQDMVTLGQESGCTLFLNNYGDDTFTKVEGVLGDNVRAGTASLADFDKDGDLDPFLIAYWGANLMRNELSGEIPVNAAPSVPTNLNVSQENGTATFSWDVSSDDLTAVEAIQYNLYVKKEGSNEVRFVLPADLTTGSLKVNESLAAITINSYKIKGLEDGNYTFGVQAIDNAKSTSLFATAEFTVGSSSVEDVAQDAINVYSAKDAIQILVNGNVAGSITICNANGVVVYTKTGMITDSRVKLPAGAYLVKVVSDNNSVVKKAIVK